ncbi:MAG: ABC transporter substrate-binding protein [Patescibacteria group bacterium]
MRKKSFIALIISGIILIGIAVLLFQRQFEQQPLKTYRIAIVTRKDVAAYEEAIQSYRKKMGDLGYIDGKNVSYNVRHYNNNGELKEIVRDVVASGYDLISTYSTPATVEAYTQTKDLPQPIPIVFGSVGDPLSAGVVHDIGRSGTNVTGVVSLATELTSNRIRLLKEIMPSIKRIAMPHSADELSDASARKSVQVAQQAAQELNINLVLFSVSSPAKNADIAAMITKEKVDGMIVGGDSLIWGGIDLYIAQAIKEKIPMAAFDLTQITKGALIGVGPDYTHVGQQAATLTHQILRGTTPATIAIQVPDKLILAVNFTTARAIGITLSDELLKRADVVIGK